MIYTGKQPLQELRSNSNVAREGNNQKISDQRTSTATQLKQQQLMRNASSSAPIQRLAYIGSKQIIEAYEGMEQYADVMSGTEQIEAPDEKQSKILSDGYYRNYANKQEFIDHTTGKPVDVGLARKLGKWYRLPFFSAKKFFVLGENHGAFGYRELIKESNQPGQVLGEGGSNALLSATPDNALQATPAGLKTDQGGLREHTMENVTAKSYFGLNLLLDAYEKAGSAAKVQTKLPEEEWLANYQKADPKNRKLGTGLNQVPYYLDEEGEKVFASYGTKAESYNPLKTAFNVVNDLKTAIDGFDNAQNDNDVKKIKPELENLIAKNGETPKDYAALIVSVKTLLNLIQPLAYRETRHISGLSKSDMNEVMEQRKKTVETNQKYDKHMSTSFSLRDEAMYRSVLKARANHIMAGMGDNHATNLKGDLASQNIPVVLLSEFVSATYSMDAIAPVGEEAQGRKPPTDESGD